MVGQIILDPNYTVVEEIPDRSAGTHYSRKCAVPGAEKQSNELIASVLIPIDRHCDVEVAGRGFSLEPTTSLLVVSSQVADEFFLPKELPHDSIMAVTITRSRFEPLLKSILTEQNAPLSSDSIVDFLADQNIKQVSSPGTNQRANAVSQTCSYLEQFPDDPAGRFSLAYSIDMLRRDLIFDTIQLMLKGQHTATLVNHTPKQVAFRIRQACDYMRQNLSSGVDILSLCSISAMSRTLFFSEFKRVTGISPTRYLRNLQIDRAKKLLTTTDLPVWEIAAECGFQSENTFYKVFARELAMSPQVYRQSHKL